MKGASPQDTGHQIVMQMQRKAKDSSFPASLVSSPLHACARKGLVKRVALTRSAGMQ